MRTTIRSYRLELCNVGSNCQMPSTLEEKTGGEGDCPAPGNDGLSPIAAVAKPW